MDVGWEGLTPARPYSVQETQCAQPIYIALSSACVTNASLVTATHARRTVYSAISNETLTWLCAPRLYISLGLPSAMDLDRARAIDSPDLRDDRHEVGRVGQVAVVQEHLGRAFVGVCVEVVQARGVEGRGPADDAVYGVAFLQQHWSELRFSVLSHVC